MGGKVQRHCLLCLMLALATSGWAQVITEEELATQQTFIEAGREKVLGHDEKAIELYRQVLERDSRNAAASFEIGRIYLSKSEQAEAVRYLKQAFEWAPDNLWYARFLADAYQGAGRNAEAAALYEQLVIKAPADTDLYLKWAYFLVRAQEIDRAIKVYDDLESRLGVNEEVSRRKHSLYLGQGDTRRAGRELEKLIETFPTQTEYRHLLAGFYQSTNEQARARTVFEEILRIDPNDAKAQLALQQQASGATATGSTDQQYLAGLMPIFERADVALDLKIGKLLPFITRVAETGDRALADAALPLTQVLERIHPDEAKPFSAAGDLYFHSGRYAEARDKYLATVARDETVYAVWEQLLTALYYTADLATLTRQAETALDIFPNRPLIYYYYALGADAQQQTDDALDALDQALLMAGRDERLKAQLSGLQAQVQAHAGQLEAAERNLEAAASVISDVPLLAHHRAQVQLVRNRLEEAVKQAATAAAAAPADRYIQAGYAQALYRKQQYAEARAQLEPVFSGNEPNWPALWELRGDIAYQLGEVDEAVRLWEKARNQGSKSKNLAKKIADRQLYE